MFENVGSKIKSLAQVVCWLGIVASVLWGFLDILSVEENYWRASSIDYLPGVLIIVIGSILSWAGSLTLYGFGELVEMLGKITQCKDVCLEQPTVSQKKYICPICGNQVFEGASVCGRCGRTFDWSHIQ